MEQIFFFNRLIYDYLLNWKKDTNKKPIVIRGARQVGKTKIIEKFSLEYKNFVYFNFERYPEDADLFSSKKPDKILNLLSIKFSKDLSNDDTLIFLDEIQSAPSLIPILRYFYEEMPNLSIIAAGSLLEFALMDNEYSIPVGRIEYLFMEPLTFEEFLLASGKSGFVDFLDNYTISESIPDSIHNEFLELLKNYIFVGGMPEAVKVYLNSKGNFLEVNKVHENILNNLKDDFNKYRKRIPEQNIRKVFKAIPRVVGKKLKYTEIDQLMQAKEIQKVLDLLMYAKLFYPVYHTSASGLPLASQTNEKFFKPLFLDVGLLNHFFEHDLLLLTNLININPVYKGALFEQFIGQNLLFTTDFYKEPEIFYWAREKPNSSAEIDYLTSVKSRIIPIEVKSGAGGSIKSLQIFLKEKNLNFGIRFYLGKPKLEKLEVTLSDSKTKIKYDLLSLPLYFVNKFKKFIE